MKEEIAAALRATVSSSLTQRRSAEAFLKRCRGEPGFAVLLLQLVQQHSALSIPSGNTQSAIIRSSAAILFKNFVNDCWEQEPDFILAKDRGAVKEHIVKLVCTCSQFQDVKQQLSQALTQIAAADFPSKWPNLLPEIVQHFDTGDTATTSGMLLSANSILKRFRNAYKSDALYSELKYVLNVMAAPLTALLMRLGQDFEVADNIAVQSGELLESVRLICRIFYSLNWLDLPEFFEDHMAEWMREFEKYLRCESNVLQSTIDDISESEGTIERVQAAVVENASLYAHKYEDEFGPFLPRFVSAIWQRLVRLTLMPKHDRLAAASMRFLAESVSKPMHTSLFSDEATLCQIIESIVIPNLLLRDSDAELFEESPFEYISRDLENADSETRRRGAHDLINALCRHHSLLTTQICSRHISTLFQQYATSPMDHWRAKDAALHLIAALAVKVETQLNLVEIYSAHVISELRSESHPQPVILADAIQFVCTFRNQLPSEELSRVLLLLGRHLLNTQVVVRSYAAACLERILAVPGKIDRRQLQQFLNPLLNALFSTFSATRENLRVTSCGDVWENDYVMKAVMRLLVVSKEDILPIAQIVAEKLCAALQRVCTNPRNPKFNHYLFESLAIVVRVSCEADGVHTSTSHFEQILFPPFQAILQMDVAEFAPYVFQILALLLGYQRSLSDAYVSLLPPLLHPMLWERRANVPALASLLKAYLVAGIDFIVQQNQLEHFLGVFQKLLASKSSEIDAFHLLKSIMLHVDSSIMGRYMPTILKLLMSRMHQNSERFDFNHMLFAFITLFAGKHGGASLADSLESQQTGLLSNLIVHVFCPHIGTSRFVCLDAKSATVGVARILCEAPNVLTKNGNAAPWSALGAILNELLRKQSGKSPPHPIDSDACDVPEDVGNNATFSKLQFGLKEDVDAFPEIQDMRQFALAHLQKLQVACPHFEPLIAALHLPDAAIF